MHYAAESPLHAEPEWNDIYEYVDEAIAALPDEFRLPVVAHFLQRESHTSIAKSVGVSRRTVARRIDEGIEQIGRFLRKRGVTVGAALLAPLLSANLAEGATLSTSLAAALGTLSLAHSVNPVASAASLGATAKLLGGILIMKKAVVGTVLVACVLVGTWVVHEHRTQKTPEEGPLASVDTKPVSQPAGEEVLFTAPAAEEEPAPPPATFSIPVTGVVLDTQEQPVSNARVQAGWHEDGETVSTISRADGTFALRVETDEKPRRISLRAEMGELDCVPKSLELPEAGLHDVTLVLFEHRASISGIVVDTKGKRMAGLRLAALVEEESPRVFIDQGSVERRLKRHPYSAALSETGPGGVFVIQNLRGGTYGLFALPWAYRFRDKRHAGYRHTYRVELKDGEDRQGLRLIWGEGAMIFGQVTNMDGEPVEGASLFAECGPRAVQEPYIGFSARTDKAGAYEIIGLPEEHDYLVELHAGSEVHITESRKDVVPGTRQDFVLLRAVVISGRVLAADTGEPIKAYWLNSWETRNDELEWGPDLSSRSDSLSGALRVDNEEGRFSLPHMGVGHITIAASAQGYRTGMAHVQATQEGESRSDIVVRLEPAEMVRGIVVDTAGNPIAKASIHPGYPASTGEVTKTAADGTFSFLLANANASIISATHPNLTAGWTDFDPDAIRDQPVRIVLSHGGRLEGMVTIDGWPAGKDEAEVRLLFPNREYFDGRVDRGNTDETGSYAVGPVTPGTINTMISLRGETYPHDAGRWLEAEVEIEDQETTHADFDFDGSYDAVIEGIMTVDEAPTKRSLVRVWATLENGNRVVVQTFCGDDGRYRLDGVPAGALDGLVRPTTSGGEYLGVFNFTVVTRSGETTQHDINIEP